MTIRDDIYKLCERVEASYGGPPVSKLITTFVKDDFIRTAYVVRRVTYCKLCELYTKAKKTDHRGNEYLMALEDVMNEVYPERNESDQCESQ